MKVCWIDLGQVGLGWDGLGCNIVLRWGTVFGLRCVGLGRGKLGWIKVCWIGLGQVGLGWDGLGCV